MSVEHTPGPWRFIPADDTPGYREAAAVIIGSQRIEFDSGLVFSPFETEANARLIASAPDLLDALQALLDLHIGHHNAIEHAAARKIIARATGAA
jgi:hypothetical protein